MNGTGKAAFIGRNGVINTYPSGGTVNAINFKIIHDASQSLMRLGLAGYFLAIVGNETILPSRDDQATLAWVNRMISNIVSRPIGFKYCTHHFSKKCDCRLPKTGLIEQFVNEMNIDLESSIMIGADNREILAADSLGLPAYRLSTGKYLKWEKDAEKYPIFDSFSECVEAICLT